MKNKEVIEKILNYHPKFPESYDGCDNYKCGNPEDECTGIVSALRPSIPVIKKAIELNANLIIVHEPTFYTSQDGPGWFENFDNAIYEEKRALLEENHITIWRDHDHMHAHNPDGIFTGVLKYLGWLDCYEADYDTGSYGHFIVNVEPMKLKDLIRHLVDKIGINGVRYIGDLEMLVSRIGLVGHLFPSRYKKANGEEGEYSVSIIKTLEEKVDVIIPGEIIDWTVMSYIKDAVDLGENKAAINLGHFNWEELGMKYVEEWLSELLENKIKVTYVPSEDMYDYFKKGE